MMKNILTFFIVALIGLPSYGQWTEYIWDTITFEAPYEFIEVDTSSLNVWQVGQPSKSIFDSAYSPDHAIVTDTSNYYPVNNHSYFDLKIGEFNYGYYSSFDVFLEFKHKFDSDTLIDGGYITVSYDDGLTWFNIINDNSNFWDVKPNNDGFSGDNIYTEFDSLQNGEFGFSGSSNGWMTTWFSWFVLPVKSTTDFWGDTMIVRFNFVSDSLETNKEGWMIDDIKLYSVELGGSSTQLHELEFRISPNPFSEIAIIELDNFQELELSISDIQGRIFSKSKFHKNEIVTINKGNLGPGVYFVKLRKDKTEIGIKSITIK